VTQCPRPTTAPPAAWWPILPCWCGALYSRSAHPPPGRPRPASTLRHPSLPPPSPSPAPGTLPSASQGAPWGIGRHSGCVIRPCQEREPVPHQAGHIFARAQVSTAMQYTGACAAPPGGARPMITTPTPAAPHNTSLSGSPAATSSVGAPPPKHFASLDTGSTIALQPGPRPAAGSWT
jgi:hypothetical protein